MEVRNEGNPSSLVLSRTECEALSGTRTDLVRLKAEHGLPAHAPVYVEESGNRLTIVCRGERKPMSLTLPAGKLSNGIRLYRGLGVA